jgi:hypothetical protein
MTVPTDPEHLVVEVDATSSIAVHRTGLGRELTHALQAAGLPTTIHVNSIGDHQEIETRSWGNALQQKLVGSSSTSSDLPPGGRHCCDRREAHRRARRAHPRLAPHDREHAPDSPDLRPRRQDDHPHRRRRGSRSAYRAVTTGQH